MILASARRFYRIKPYLTQLDLLDCDNYTIAFNGNLIVCNDGTVLADQPLDPNDIMLLEKYIREQPDLDWFFYHDQGRIDYHELSDVVAFLKIYKVYKVVAFGTAEKICQSRKMMPQVLTDHLTVTSSEDERMEMVAKGMNKVDAIKYLADRLNIKREEINISSTEIRKNPYKYYDFLPKIVQRYYVKKVCVIGTESCGKSTLVRNLAKYFNTTYVEEAGRFICDEAGGIDNMQKYHYFEILFKHKQIEKEAKEHANKVLIIDTDSLITLYYYQLGFKNDNQKDKDFENIATSISNLNNYDLYIFLEPDVKWVQDGTRTYGSDEVREKNNKKLKQILDKNGIKYTIIKGNYQERYEQSKEKIKKLIQWR